MLTFFFIFGTGVLIAAGLWTAKDVASNIKNSPPPPDTGEKTVVISGQDGKDRPSPWDSNNNDYDPEYRPEDYIKG